MNRLFTLMRGKIYCMYIINSICETMAEGIHHQQSFDGIQRAAAKSLMTRITPAQVECQQPSQDSFIYTRTMSPAKSAPSRDPCNYPGGASGAVCTHSSRQG
jgi:hypothetical protein